MRTALLVAVATVLTLVLPACGASDPSKEAASRSGVHYGPGQYKQHCVDPATTPGFVMSKTCSRDTTIRLRAFATTPTVAKVLKEFNVDEHGVQNVVFGTCSAYATGNSGELSVMNAIEPYAEKVSTTVASDPSDKTFIMLAGAATSDLCPWYQRQYQEELHLSQQGQ